MPNATLTMTEHDTTHTTHTTDLQSALIEAGLTAIQFATGGRPYTTPVTALPDATLVRILQYGKRMLNDSVNSAAASSDKPKTDLAAEWLARAKAGTLGTPSTRTTIDPVEREARTLVIGLLRADGLKARVAREIVTKGAEAAFRDYLRRKLATRLGCPEADVKENTLDEAVAKNWPGILRKAKQIVEGASAALDIDI